MAYYERHADLSESYFWASAPESVAAQSYSDTRAALRLSFKLQTACHMVWERSSLLATVSDKGVEQVGLDLLMRKHDVFQCHSDGTPNPDHFSAVMASTAILEQGYNLDCLMQRYQGLYSVNVLIYSTGSPKGSMVSQWGFDEWNEVWTESLCEWYSLNGIRAHNHLQICI